MWVSDAFLFFFHFLQILSVLSLFTHHEDIAFQRKNWPTLGRTGAISKHQYMQGKKRNPMDWLWKQYRTLCFSLIGSRVSNIKAQMSGDPVHISIIYFSFLPCLCVLLLIIRLTYSSALSDERLNIFKWQPLIFQADQTRNTPFIVWLHTVGSNAGPKNIKHLCSSETSHSKWPIFRDLNLSPQSGEPLVM